MNYETHGPNTGWKHDSGALLVLGFICGLVIGVLITAIMLT